jgi:protoheme IX farnesyltransferase
LSLSGGAVVFLILLGIYFLYHALNLMQKRTKETARKLMYASIAYISILQVIYVLDKWI